MFTSISKEEYELADTFLNDEMVRVKNEMVPDGGLLLAVAGDSDGGICRVSLATTTRNRG